MSEPVILHRERVIHRNVRSREGMDIANIISEARDTFIVMQDTSRENKAPNPP